MNTRMPVGIDDYKTAREQFYVVDKTRFIAQLIENQNKVMLFTRPRRFGKTLTMSMVDYFFSIDKLEQTEALFHGTDIEAYGTKYMKYRGKYPVIFITLKDCAECTWEETYEQFMGVMQVEYQKHSYLLNGKSLQEEEKEQIQRFLHKTATMAEYKMSLWYLTSYLYKYFKMQPIVLIDEYDAPLQSSYSQHFYDNAIAFFRRWLSCALKSNVNLKLAVLTGVQRIAKESIFSGLNNLIVCSVVDSQASDIFGFNATEIDRMTKDLQVPEKLQEIKTWYDGYQFGSQEIYNPWSVVCYFYHQCTPKPYWVNTSENGILKELLLQADELRVCELQGLLSGKAITTTISDGVVYQKIWQDDSALYTMLLTTGYLTVEKVSNTTYNRYALRIPNEEIRQVYGIEILNSLVNHISRNSYDALFDSLFSGDGKDFEYRLQRILTRFVSSYDTANKESFYHGFMLGMTALFLDKDYVVESNRESGYGRFDVAVFPRDTNKTGVILEFKASSSVDCLIQEADDAVRQIQTREYVTEFEKRKIAHLWTYGIAFCGKQVKLM